MKMPTKKELFDLKTKYYKGSCVEVIKMQGEPAMTGMRGVVSFIDDMAQIHVNWETGSSLALIPEVDAFKKIKATTFKTAGGTKGILPVDNLPKKISTEWYTPLEEDGWKLITKVANSLGIIMLTEKTDVDLSRKVISEVIKMLEEETKVKIVEHQVEEKL